MKHFWILLSLLALIACSRSVPTQDSLGSTPTGPPTTENTKAPVPPPAPVPEPQPTASTPGGTMEHVIVPADRASDFFHGMNGERAAGTWVPTEAQAQALEGALIGYLRGQLEAAGVVTRGLARYRVQYIGIVRDGHQVIFGNFFCDVFDGADWRREPYIVDDGGDCFFQIEFDPAAGSFSRLMINGDG